MSNNIETILDQLGLIYKRNEDIDSIMTEIEGPKPTTAPPKQAPTPTPTPVPVLSPEQQAKISIFKKLFYNNMKNIQHKTPYPIDTDGKYIGDGFDCDGTQLKFGDQVKILNKEWLNKLYPGYKIENISAKYNCYDYINYDSFISNDDDVNSSICKEIPYSNFVCDAQSISGPI